MSQLLYDSNLDTKMSRQDLRQLKTPDPMGPRHHPYPFSDFADNTVNAIERAGYTVTSEDFAVQKDGQRMFGILKVSNAPNHIPAQNLDGYAPTQLSVPTSENVPALYKPQWDLVIGVRGAHDQSVARGLVVGSHVTVCSNLCFSGDLGEWKRKQTTNVEFDMPAIIGGAISQLNKKQREFTIDFDAFNRIQISQDDGDRILLDILRDNKDSLSASQFERALHHWDVLPDGYERDSKGKYRLDVVTRQPIYRKENDVSEHGNNGRNLWWLFNACTHGLKPTGSNSNHSDKADQSLVVYKHLKAAVDNYENSGRVRLLN
jgi:hypothetical protein